MLRAGSGGSDGITVHQRDGHRRHDVWHMRPSRIIASVRTSINTQDLNSQKLQNLISKSAFSHCGMWETLVVTELSRLGRSAAKVIVLVNELVTRNILVMLLKQSLGISQHDMNSKIVITLFSLFADVAGSGLSEDDCLLQSNVMERKS